MLASVIVFFVVLSVLILVHELGHFIAAKRSGVWVEEFGFGLPPKLVGIKIGQTLFSINALPFGGFCRLHGEIDEEAIIHPRRAFLNKNKKTRFAIVIAGIVMNLILAVVAFAAVYSLTGIPKETKNVKIVEIATGSPAQASGLIVGDIVRKVDKESVASTNEFIKAIEVKKGKRVTLEIARDSISKKISLTPRENPPTDEGPLGVIITTTELWFPAVWQRPFIGIYYGVKDALFWGKTVVEGIISIFRDLFRGVAPKDVAGPIGIYAITSQVAKNGFLAILNLVGILSINLAILNIIPFPALDGGRLLFIAIEGVIGKKIIPKVEATIHTIGMAILILLLLAITAHDIINVMRAGSISKFVESIVK